MARGELWTPALHPNREMIATRRRRAITPVKVLVRFARYDRSISGAYRRISAIETVVLFDFVQGLGNAASSSVVLTHRELDWKARTCWSSGQAGNVHSGVFCQALDNTIEAIRLGIR